MGKKAKNINAVQVNCELELNRKSKELSAFPVSPEHRFAVAPVHADHNQFSTINIMPLQTTTLYIKNMVCPRCIKVVREELTKLGLDVRSVTLGEVVVSGATAELPSSRIRR